MRFVKMRLVDDGSVRSGAHPREGAITGLQPPHASTPPCLPHPPTVGETLLRLLRHPAESLLRQWNWKSAVTSASVRGTLFFFVNLGAGVAAAAGAMSIEAAFYIAASGFYGALTEAFRRARPSWLATLTITVLIPAINHTLEVALHRTGGTKKLLASVVASICLSMLSNVFSLFAMRRGAFIVGIGRQSLLEDFRQLPRIIYDFLAFVPRSLWCRQR